MKAYIMTTGALFGLIMVAQGTCGNTLAMKMPAGGQQGTGMSTPGVITRDSGELSFLNRVPPSGRSSVESVST